jgi:uncharacterized membrane protein
MEANRLEAFSDGVIAEIKGWISVGIYVIGVLVALLWTPWVALALYALVALMWLVPDRRIERALGRQ